MIYLYLWQSQLRNNTSDPYLPDNKPMPGNQRTQIYSSFTIIEMTTKYNKPTTNCSRFVCWPPGLVKDKYGTCCKQWNQRVNSLQENVLFMNQFLPNMTPDRLQIVVLHMKFGWIFTKTIAKNTVRNNCTCRLYSVSDLGHCKPHTYVGLALLIQVSMVFVRSANCMTFWQKGCWRTLYPYRTR